MAWDYSHASCTDAALGGETPIPRLSEVRSIAFGARIPALCFRDGCSHGGFPIVVTAVPAFHVDHVLPGIDDVHQLPRSLSRELRFDLFHHELPGHFHLLPRYRCCPSATSAHTSNDAKPARYVVQASMSGQNASQ